MLEEGYTSLLTDKYQLTDSESIHTVDFENDNEGATEQINQWIYRNTNGMIDPMYEEPLDPDMAILLSSSLYFKGTVKNMVYFWAERLGAIAFWALEYFNFQDHGNPSFKLILMTIVRVGANMAIPQDATKMFNSCNTMVNIDT